MASHTWGVDGPEVSWSDAIHTPVGSRCDIVVTIACRNVDNNDCLAVLYPCNTSARITGLSSLKVDTFSVTVFDALCIRDGCMMAFAIDDQSHVVEHTQVQWSHFSNMLELCSGMGVATWGFGEAGIVTKLACEVSAPMAEAFQHMHEGSHVIVGDLSSRQVMKEICQFEEHFGLLFAGFPCQPYSRGGSQAGAADVRSSPLVSILKIAILRRIPVVLLECVPDAATNKWVRHVLMSFCNKCKYHLTETILRQEQVWPCKRERWWAILSASTIGPIPVKPLPIYRFPERIRQILPRDLKISLLALQQLQIVDEELHRFVKFCGDLGNMLLNRGGVCPTVLHSMGSQMVACHCGCRANGFSDASLTNRGVYGFLMGGDKSEVVGQEAKFRHPHPTEIAILTACPIVEWHDDLRLMLAGLGQQATPIHALWIGAQVKCRLAELIFGDTQNIQPRKILDLYIEKMLKQAKSVVHVAPECRDDHADEMMDEPEVVQSAVAKFATQVHSLGLAERRHVGGTESVSVFTPDSAIPAIVHLASSELTVGHLRAAEVGSVPTVGFFDVVDGLSGESLPNSCALAGRSVLLQPIEIDSESNDGSMQACEVEPIMEVDDVDISPTIPFHVHQSLVDDFAQDAQEVQNMEETKTSEVSFHDPLASLQPHELIQLLPPVVPSLKVLQGLTSPQMTPQQRVAIMNAQDMLWSDDEIRWQLQRILERANNESKVLMDPLLATHVMVSGQTGLLYQWFNQQSASVRVIITTVWTNGHWTPFAWTWNEQCLMAHSWDVQSTVVNCNLLHDHIAKAVGARTYMCRTEHRQFASTTMCGVCAVRWLDHFVSGRMLPSNQSEAEQLHHLARQFFLEYVQNASNVARPWIWAHGLDALVEARLVDMLQQHGVPKSEVDQRLKIVVNALGVNQVQRAVTGTSPWRSLKALANNHEPKIQLVLPNELAEVIKQKASQGGVTKTKGKKRIGDTPKPNLGVPAQIDPSKIVIDKGVFVDEMGNPVSQIHSSTLGPLASGIAIMSFGAAYPFLQAGRQVSHDALAIFIINVSDCQVETDLPWFQCRIAARCIANGEPLLLTGYLVQLGKLVVSLAKKQSVIDAGDVQAACVKAAIYRDSFSGNWDEFVKAPVRYVLQCLPALQVCENDETCCCGKWHRKSDSQVKDPILDVWRRQWLNLSFKPTTPASADIFVVCIRYVQDVELQVLTQSGSQGLFLEPRSLDSKLATNDFQVIWMARSTLSELTHLKQTVQDIVGIARLGSRLGIRTKVQHAASVGQIIKPDAILLQTGT